MVNNRLHSLLAIIHRDGGHHTEKVGEEQSFEDAHKVWAKQQIEIERLKTESGILKFEERIDCFLQGWGKGHKAGEKARDTNWIVR